MDVTKCRALKSELAKQLEPRVASVERFFDGNDDPGSIGWDLTEPHDIDAFQDLLTGLLRRPDVEAVYARIVDLDMGEDDCWPSADIFFVVGTISADELRNILSPLKPCEVCSVNFAVPDVIKEKHQGPFVAAHWS
jgi:hypothetical protein